MAVRASVPISSASRAYLPCLGQRGEQLRGQRQVVVTGAAGARSAAHQPRQRRQGVDRRIDAVRVHLRGEDDLAFGDVAGQVGHRVGDVAAGHRQHGQDRDRAGPAVDLAAALVERSQVAVEIAGIGAASRDFAARGRDFPHRLGVAGHVRHARPVRARRRRTPDARRWSTRVRGVSMPLDDRVVGGVQQQHQFACRAASSSTSRA